MMPQSAHDAQTATLPGPLRFEQGYLAESSVQRAERGSAHAISKSQEQDSHNGRCGRFGAAHSEGPSTYPRDIANAREPG